MKDLHKGLSVSAAVHVLVIGSVFALWVDRSFDPKVISLDFSILNFDEKGTKAGGHGRDDPEHQTFFLKGRRSVRSNPTRIDQGINPSAIKSSLALAGDSVSPGVKGTYGDREGDVEVYGMEGSPGGQQGNETGSSYVGGNAQQGGGGAYGSTDGLTIRYGDGGVNEKTFGYIRDDILKNVKYPDKARRKGYSGKILVAFTVTESGRARDVRIVNGSGYSELDAGAKDAVERTTFSRKIPYKLFVTLPIVFRLE